jgi:SulP family sulfate permease
MLKTFMNTISDYVKSRPTAFHNYLKNGGIQGDVIAGIVTGSVVVPQSMSYALLANLPPQVGIYSSISLVAYAVVGSCSQLSVAPVATASLLVGMSTLGSTNIQQAVDTAVSIAFLAGIFQIFLGVTRLGEFITRWLSRTMLCGYTTGVAVTIMISQLPAAFGVKIQTSAFPIYNLTLFFIALPQTKPPAFVMFLVCLILLLLAQKVIKPRLKPRIRFLADFSTLIVVIVGSAVAYALTTSYPAIQLPLVGKIPIGYLAPKPPPLESINTSTIGTAFAVSLITFFEGFAVAKTLAKSGQLSVAQELLGVGFANIASSFFNGFTVSGGLSRTMVNVNAGAVSQFSSIVAFSVTLLAAFVLSPVMQYIPNSLLSSIICVAVLAMVKTEALKETYKIAKTEFLVCLTTSLTVIGIGPIYGLAYGVALSIVVALYKLAIPHVAELGEMRGGLLRNLKRYPNEAKQIPGIILVRLDAPIFYANAPMFFKKCHTLIKEREKENKEKIECFLVDASGVGWIDLSGLHELLRFKNQLSKKKILLILAEVRGPVRDAIRRFNEATKNDVVPFYESYPLLSETSVESDGDHEEKSEKRQDMLSFSLHSLDEALARIRKRNTSSSAIDIHENELTAV